MYDIACDWGKIIFFHIDRPTTCHAVSTQGGAQAIYQLIWTDAYACMLFLGYLLDTPICEHSEDTYCDISIQYVSDPLSECSSVAVLDEYVSCTRARLLT